MAIEQVQNLPQQYVTDLGVDYGKQLAGLTSIPLDTARLAPQVAAQDPLQTQAYNLAGQVLEHTNLILHNKQHTQDHRLIKIFNLLINRM